ncbi:hypothetical protein PG637_10255 [Riemerella anatipestifer]|nr:hypothetical protein [Riemerella anatipestifer]MDY3326049.1 hypothetical protein [Riemerella anatipestifer]MDY3354399.1 hypothetical protein [Riemerella anatipestifer]
MKNIFLTLFTVLFVIVSCNKEATQSKNTSEITSSSAKVIDASIQIKDFSGKPIGAFNLEDSKIQIADKIYESKSKGDKKKYYSNGAFTYEVKLKDDGFKLRNAESKLLWKVKIYPDKIKISDNEESTNPFEIKNRNGSIEIIKNEHKIATITIKDGKVNVNGKESYIISPTNNQYVLGVLGIEEIPMNQRLFIILEYFCRTK